MISSEAHLLQRGQGLRAFPDFLALPGAIAASYATIDISDNRIAAMGPVPPDTRVLVVRVRHTIV